MRIPALSVLFRGLLSVFCCAALAAMLTGSTSAQGGGQPFATLVPMSTTEFVNETDSNSPIVWDYVSGVPTVHVLNSVAGQTQLSVGRTLSRLMDLEHVSFSTAPPPGGVWIESVIPASDGTWYGYYHNEIASDLCPGSGRVMPRIGAARSRDRGRTWEDLGPILSVPRATANCATRNAYFVGGIGDLSALLDPVEQFLYIYYTQYVEQDGLAGVSAARMAWADRDQPVGRVEVWQHGVWLPATLMAWRDEATGETIAEEWQYPFATPIHAAADRWDNTSREVDVYWGPAVHWNTHLQSGVMLLNRAVDNGFKPGGIYISFNPRLGDPTGWTAPVKLLDGGKWYPQVVGTGRGTDKQAGETARFYMSGTSDHTIVFGRR
jgi:hypothetical protein